MRRPDRGSASPLVLAVIGVVVALAGVTAHVGGAMVADARASGAADLAALAAAREDRDARAQGHPPAAALRRACDVAAAVADLNGATITHCTRGSRWSVTVAVSTSAGVGPWKALARSRAGPTWG